MEIVVRCLVVLGLVACGPPGRGELAIDRVEPATGPATQATPVHIIGAAFHLPITSDVDDGKTVIDDMAISIGDAPLADAAWIGLGQIDGTVPAGLPLGPHDVRVRLGDREDVLFGGYVVTSEAGPDGGLPVTNVVATSNGGVLESFTSEYCAPVGTPSNCQSGYWDHTNVNDGQYAMGNGPVPFRASWASGRKVNTSPEEFVFSFAGGASATIERVVIQNYGEEGGLGPYYATRFSLFGEPPTGGGFVPLLLDQALVADESVQPFDLTAPVVVRRLRLSITASVASDYWEIGEFEAWGRLP